MNLRKAILIRSRIAFLAIFLLAVRIVWQIADLQFNQKDKYLSISKEQSMKLTAIQASRGNIYADDGSLLATSIPKYNLHFDTRVPSLTNEYFNEHIDSLAWNLAQVFKEKSESEWRNYLVAARQRGEQYLDIQDNVDYQTVKEMESWPIWSKGRYKGGFIKEESFRREIPYGILAKRTIGYSKPTRTGIIKIGLEGAYDSLLTGTVGKRLVQRTIGGVWKPVGTGNQLEPRNGFDLYTTIDINLQDVAENALQECLLKNNADHGCAVLMEVGTGAVKAIANLRRHESGVYYEAENYAVNEFADPGSTFKLISAMALLEDKMVAPDDSIDISYGKTEFGDVTMVDAHESPFKRVSFRYAFEHSSNVGIAKTVNKYYASNPGKFLAHGFSLQLNQRLGFDISPTRDPEFKNSNDRAWSGVSLPFMSIGYEMELSPLQILSVYNAVANNGKMVQPYLVKEIREFGKVVQKFDTRVINEKVCSDQTIKQLKSLLEGVVERGTATNLKGLDYKVAGKTGTAQIVSGSGYDKSSHKASFVGYFPAENPKYSCIVVVSAPKNGIYYGGSVAGPVFKEIADKVYSTRLDLHNPIKLAGNPGVPVVKNGNRDDISFVLNRLGVSNHKVEGESGSEWVKSIEDKYSIQLNDLSTHTELVPDVRGMGLKDALYLLENRGFKVWVEGYGAVVYQSIAPGTRIRRRGERIILQLKT